MSRRIVQIIPTLVRGGAEKQLVLLAQGLARADFDVHVITLTAGGPLRADLDATGIPVTAIDKRWKLDPGALQRLTRELKRLRPDLVHTWLFAANAYGRAAALRAGVPHIVGAERCVDLWKAWHELAIDRYLARRSDRVVVNSSGVRDFYIGKGIAADKFAVIPNGVPPAPPSDVTREALLAELNLPPDAKLIGAVGRLWPQKRLKDLIWGADILKVIREDFHLLIVGEGPQFDRLRRFRHKCQIDDRVHFLGQRNDVPRLIPHFDVLWLGSAYEGQPNSVMEAMSAGVPVVATDIAGTRDLVVPGETGYLVPVGDCAAFARHTDRLFNEVELARRLGSAGRARMLREFSVERMVERHIALYRELLGG
ncbi:MAG: glycosyltransferase [Pirellulales bacterium]|nr:glycosyltransferase [Pirellulales bacterium]